jgi:hypothetical protein
MNMKLAGSSPSLSSADSSSLPLHRSALPMQHGRHREDAAATRLPQQLPSSLIARPRTFEQPDGDVDADAHEIRRVFS